MWLVPTALCLRMRACVTMYRATTIYKYSYLSFIFWVCCDVVVLFSELLNGRWSGDVMDWHARGDGRDFSTLTDSRAPPLLLRRSCTHVMMSKQTDSATPPPPPHAHIHVNSSFFCLFLLIHFESFYLYYWGRWCGGEFSPSWRSRSEASHLLIRWFVVLLLFILPLLLLGNHQQQQRDDFLVWCWLVWILMMSWLLVIGLVGCCCCEWLMSA